MGRLLPPVDVNSEDKLSDLEKRISIGPVTLVFVYADWCGHCTKFKPEMDKLEASPDRSIQTARIRDDMLSKSSLNGTKINGYPSLMLIKKNGEATTFKDKDGEVTNASPEHNDLNKMMTIVRSAGTPEGIKLLNGANINKLNTIKLMNNSENPVEEESVEENTMNTPMNTPLYTPMNSPVPTNAVSDRVPLTRNQTRSLNATMSGGSMGLWGHLLSASQNIAPAAALFLASSALTKGKRRKTRKGRKGKDRKGKDRK